MDAKQILRFVLAAVAGFGWAGVATAGDYRKTPSGIVVQPDGGDARRVRLDVLGRGIFHVEALDRPARPQMKSLAVIGGQASPFTVERRGGFVLVKAADATARVSLETGLVTFLNREGRAVLSEQAARITPVTVEGQSYVATSAQFNRGTDEALYGLGQHQNGQLNLNGEDVLLSQHNMDVAVPFIVSDRNYGLLWDNYSITRFGDATPYGLFGRDLTLRTDDGQPGLRARYYIDEALALTRIEDDIRYQYQKDVDENLPPAIQAALKAGRKVRVEWDGTMRSAKAGVHKMQLYASDTATLTLDDKPIMSVWRQNWNPWYHNFESRLSPASRSGCISNGSRPAG